MRIANENELKRLLEGSNAPGQGMAPSVRMQIEKALAEVEDGKRTKPPCPIKKAKASVPVESAGEAWVRIALTAEFGDWFQGGEVVAELLPFSNRKFRSDFSLPRYSIYIEVDGWSHHGKSLDDHHSDRLRGLYFSQHNWLPFRVSHAQAKDNAPELIEAIKGAMAIREPLPRNALEITRRKLPSGYRCTMHPPADARPDRRNP